MHPGSTPAGFDPALRLGFQFGSLDAEIERQNRRRRLVKKSGRKTQGRTWERLATAKRLVPITLKPGQRLPTAEDDAAAAADLTKPKIGHFPEATRWEITPEHCQAWESHAFTARRGDTNSIREGVDPCEDEFCLLTADLLLHASMRRRGLPVPPLAEYLQPGREGWGRLRPQIEEGIETGQIDPQEHPSLAREAGLWDDERDAAIAALLDSPWSVAELRLLNVEHVDLEAGTVWCWSRGRRGEHVELDEWPLYLLESYLDLRPELPGKDPLFLSREGGRLSLRQMQRVAAAAARKRLRAARARKDGGA